MCKVISLTVNKEVDLAAIHMLTNNWYVLEASWCPAPPEIPKGRYYLTYRGHCNCDSMIGAASYSRTVPYTEEELEALVAKGGTHAKLERWKTNRVQAYERKIRKLQVRIDRRHFELEGWLELARQVLALPGAKRFGILHHWYGEATFHATIAELVPIAKATPETLVYLPEDTLLEFTRHASW